MTEFPIQRRDLLRTTGAGMAGAAGLGQTGATQESTAGGDLVWEFEASNAVHASPTVVDGTVYVGGLIKLGDPGPSVYALDAGTGETVWTFDTDSWVRTSPQVVDGTVYIGSLHDESVYALDAETGQQVWRSSVGGNIVDSSPTVAGGTVYVGSEDTTVHALDAGTGEEVWAFDNEFEAGIESSPTVVDGTVYIGSQHNNVYALDAETGAEVWRFETGDSVYSSPTVADGTVYVGGVDSNIYALDTASGEDVWTFETGNSIYASPTVADGTVYVGSRDSNLYAVDAATGSEEWASTQLSGPMVSSPTVADGVAYTGMIHGLRALDIETGETMWTFETTIPFVDSSPTVVAGTVYFGSQDIANDIGRVYAVDAGVDGSSEDSRVNLGTLGHHHTWAGTDPPTAGTVTGQVSNQAGTPLSDVTLEFVPAGADSPEKTVETDDSGSYEAALPDGEYLIVIDGEPFVPREIPVLVTTDETASVDVTLTQTNASATISTLRVKPDALLRGVDSDLAFVVGAEADDTGVEVATVDVEFTLTGESFSAVRIDTASKSTLQTALRSLGVTVPTDPSTDTLVALFEDLLGLGGGQIYTAVVPQAPTPLEVGGNEFVVQVTASDGSLAASQVAVPLYEPGARLDSFETTATGPTVEFSRDVFLIDYDFNFGEDLLPDNLPIQLDVPLFDADLNYTGRGGLDLNTLAATAASRGAGGVSILGTAGIEFQAGGRWNGAPDGFTYTLNLVDLWLATLLQVPIPLPKRMNLTLPDNLPAVGGDEVGIELDATWGGYMLVGSSDPDTPGSATGAAVNRDTSTATGQDRLSQTAEFPVPEHREFNTYTTLEGIAGVGVVEAFLSGEIQKATDLFTAESIITPPVGLPIEPVGGTVCLDGGIRVAVGPAEAEVSIGTLADATPGFDDPCVSLGEVRQPPCWDVFDIDGNCQEYPSPTSLVHLAGGYDISDTDVELQATAGQNPPADAVTAGTDTAGLTRLTDRPERDTGPAVTARADSHLAVWERHPEDSPAEEGRTLVTATRDGTGWSEPASLAETTATGASYHEPAPATSAGTAAIAWTRYDIDETEAPVLDEATRIEVVLEEGNGWSEPVVVAETDAWVDRTPSIAPLGEGWVVAWERAKTDSDTRAVGYAVLDAAGAVQQSETIEGATQLALGTDSGSVVLGYHDLTAQEVRRDLVTGSGRTTDDSDDLEAGLSVRDIAVCSGATAWLVTGEETTAGFYDEGAGVEELEFVSRDSRVSRLGLLEPESVPVLTAARVPEDDSRARMVTYRVRNGDAWGAEQVPASTDAGADVVVRESAVAPATEGEGLVSLVEARVHDPDAVSDIVAVEQPFRPNYAIAAETDQGVVPPGEDLTVSYTVENTGDLDGADPVPVEVRSQGNTLADEQEGPLARGETASGQLTFAVDETGTAEVVVGRNLDLLAPGERRTTVEASTPRLAVESTSVERPSEGTAIATLQIRNGGPVDADPFEVAVYAGDGALLGDAEVAGPAAGECGSVTVEFDPAALTPADAEELHIDPATTLPDSHVTQRVEPVLLGRPDVTIAEDIEYSETGGGAVATLGLTNAGPVSTSVAVRAVQSDATPEAGSFADEDSLGTVVGSLPAAIDGIPQTAELSLALEGVAYGDEVRFIIESGRPVAGAGIPVVSDRVGPFSGVPALPGYERPPRDPNGDGLYEDVDGDGTFDIFDVQALFNGLGSDAVQNNPGAFTFGDGGDSDEVTVLDVQGLFERLTDTD
jgi:outer membrane protein assembly factor BamB